MTQRILPAMLLAAIGLSCATPVEAQHGQRFFDTVVRDFHRNNCWPQPFTGPDRQAVRTPFELMVKNGWERQNLLGDHYFDGPDQALTEAGSNKVRWILEQAPVHHRTIYVRRGKTADDTAERVAAVRGLATEIAPEQKQVAIVESNLPSVGWPAANVDAIDRSFRDSAPAPRLPAPVSTDGGM